VSKKDSMAFAVGGVRLTPRHKGGGSPGRRPEKTLADLREKFAREDPEFQKAWEALEVKRKIVAILLRLRKKANLTQRELATRAGWDPAFVCRLESFPSEGEKLYMPDITTLMQYAKACDSDLSLMFSEPKGRGSSLHIIESMPLTQSDRLERAMLALSDTKVAIKNHKVHSVQKLLTES